MEEREIFPEGSPTGMEIKIQCQDFCYKTNKNFKGKFKSEWNGQ